MFVWFSFFLLRLAKRSNLCSNTYLIHDSMSTQSVWDRRDLWVEKEKYNRNNQRIDNDKILRELRPMFIRFDLIGLKRLNHWHITWPSIERDRMFSVHWQHHAWAMHRKGDTHTICGYKNWYELWYYSRLSYCLSEHADTHTRSRIYSVSWAAKMLTLGRIEHSQHFT